jgi:MerR family copper efflux transcriptional regulator
VGEKKAMRIAELAKRAGVSTATLRFYEEQGLLAPVGRTEAGYREYGAAALGRLGFIRRAKALGLSLREVRSLVESPGDSTDDHARLRTAVAHKLADTRRRVEQLQTLARELEALDEHLRRGKVWCGRIGDCGCWLPTKEEVMRMTTDEQTTSTGDCTCGDGCGCGCEDECADGSCDCGCCPGCC